VEYSSFDRHPAYARGDDRRGRPGDRRGGLRRESDRAQRMREMAAFAFAMCGGLAVLYLFFVVIGTIAIGDAAVATVAAVVLALIWLVGFRRRLRTGAAFAQRPDRERRGF
jgi:Flp pilus assembly protein TadB